MKQWILPALLTAVASVLVVAVLSPDATRDILSVPKGWVEAKHAGALKARTVREWTDVRRRASDGDAKAMYRLGMKLRFPTDQQVSGVPVDPAAGVDLIRSAADAGHLGAMIEVWKLNGRPAADLVRIAERAPDAGHEPNELAGLVDWLQWTAVQECDETVRDAAVKIAGSLLESGHASASDTARYRAFPEMYSRRCDSRR